MKFNGNLKLTAVLLIGGLIVTSIFEAQFKTPTEVTEQTTQATHSTNKQLISIEDTGCTMQTIQTSQVKDTPTKLQEKVSLPVDKNNLKGKLSLNPNKIGI